MISIVRRSFELTSFQEKPEFLLDLSKDILELCDLYFKSSHSKGFRDQILANMRMKM